MPRSVSMKIAIAVALSLSGAAVAGVAIGGKLYVRARDTRLMASSDPRAKVSAVLQPGDEVLWDGADPANKEWQRVRFGERKGVVFKKSLATKPPSAERVASAGGKEVDSQAFASSGAATKLLGDGAVGYGEKKDWNDSVKGLLALEALAKGVDPAKVAAHERNAFGQSEASR